MPRRLYESAQQTRGGAPRTALYLSPVGSVKKLSL
mgnify:CR=1 FL=1